MKGSALSPPEDAADYWPILPVFVFMVGIHGLFIFLIFQWFYVGDHYLYYPILPWRLTITRVMIGISICTSLWVILAAIQSWLESRTVYTRIICVCSVFTAVVAILSPVEVEKFKAEALERLEDSRSISTNNIVKLDEALGLLSEGKPVPPRLSGYAKEDLLDAKRRFQDYLRQAENDLSNINGSLGPVQPPAHEW